MDADNNQVFVIYI